MIASTHLLPQIAESAQHQPTRSRFLTSVTVHAQRPLRLYYQSFTARQNLSPEKGYPYRHITIAIAFSLLCTRTFFLPFPSHSRHHASSDRSSDFRYAAGDDDRRIRPGSTAQRGNWKHERHPGVCAAVWFRCRWSRRRHWHWER